MVNQLQTSKVQLLIAQLYRKTGVPAPSVRQPVAPLGELIGHFNLILVEIAELTEQKAYLHLAQRGGVVMPPRTAGKEPLSGFLYTTRRFGAIFIGNDKNEPVTRRRFSAAHELGHYLKHFLPYLANIGTETDIEPVRFIDRNLESQETNETSNLTAAEKAQVISNSIKLPPLAQMEQEADEFAVELLMPEALIRELALNYGTGYSEKELVGRLASEMLVSHIAIERRLKNLMLASNQ